MEYSELISYVKSLANRIDYLEKENEKLKNCIFKKKKIEIVDQLNEETKNPPMRFKEWIENLDYKSSIETVFQEDLHVGCIELLEKGVNNISLIDYEQLPLRIFSNKPNSFYIYDIVDIEENIAKWTPILIVDLDKWFSYIGKRFLIEFKTWFDRNEELINNDEKMSNKYVEFLQKTLGGQRMTEEGRNYRLRQHIYKSIKQSIKNS